MNLRPYQEKLISDIREQMVLGKKAILAQLATGGGKTLLTAKMIKTCQDKGMSAYWVTHRRELVGQVIRAFDMVGIKFDVLANGFFETRNHKVKICSIGTLRNRVKYLKQPNLAVFDEAHHCPAQSWKTVFAAFPNSFKLGLTATSERLDGRGLGDFFEVMVKGPSVQWLIQNGFLAPYKLYAPSTVDLTGVKKVMGEYSKPQLSSAMDKPLITGDAIKEYKKLAPGKRALVFAASREHSKHVVADFNAAGVPAAHVDGETPTEERDRATERFSRGEILVLSNVELFGEGYDLPGIECVIQLRPTLSLALYLQQVGRGLRPSEGKKEVVILDHAGNCERHGLPDEDREWSLEGHSDAKKKEAKGLSIRICPKCFAAQYAGVSACRFCGAIFKIKAREVAEKEGELSEVDIERLRKEKRREQGRAYTFEELVEVGKKRGMKRPHGWAKHVFDARQAKKLQAGRI